jgi:ubiquinone/menaquinone biosynthesis C-methylase UbiE
MHWYLREVVRPHMSEDSQILEVGGSRVSIQRVMAQAVIGPSRCTFIDTRSLRFHAGIELPHRFMNMDATKLQFADDHFDVILCNNTLPYIRDDRGALAEMFRCLKSDGIAVLDSDYAGERTQTVAEYRRRHPELGDEYFAENGDQWVYGMDYVSRIEAAGFKARIDVLFDDCSDHFKHEHGLKSRQALTVAFKSPYGRTRFALQDPSLKSSRVD